jgi:hypothetical protein
VDARATVIGELDLVDRPDRHTADLHLVARDELARVVEREVYVVAVAALEQKEPRESGRRKDHGRARQQPCRDLSSPP